MQPESRQHGEWTRWWKTASSIIAKDEGIGIRGKRTGGKRSRGEVTIRLPDNILRLFTQNLIKITIQNYDIGIRCHVYQQEFLSANWHNRAAFDNLINVSSSIWQMHRSAVNPLVSECIAVIQFNRSTISFYFCF